MTTKTITFNELKATLKNQNLQNIYCFCGNDESKKEEAISLISSHIWKSENPKDYKTLIYFAEDGLEIALTNIASSSLFEQKLLHIIKHCEKVPASKKIHIMIQECITHLPNSSFVIFDTSENKPPALIPHGIYSYISCIQFYKPFEEDCKSHIIKKCKELSLTITPDTIDILVELTANNIKEIDKILDAISFSGHSNIDNELLEGFVINEKELIEFELVDMFFLKEKKAWDLFVEALERNINQIYLLSLLFNHALKLEAFHLQSAKGIPFDELMKELKIYGKRQKIFAKQASIFTLDKIRKLISKLYIYDLRLKGYLMEGFSQENPLLELLLQNNST